MACIFNFFWYLGILGPNECKNKTVENKLNCILPPFLIRLWWTLHGSSEGPDAALRFCVSLTHKDMTFRYCSSGCQFFFYYMCLIFSTFQIHMMRYAKFSANRSFEVTLLSTQACQTMLFLHFPYIHLKKCDQMMCFCNGLLVKKCLKIQFKTEFMLNCLLYVDTRLLCLELGALSLNDL